jgi:hypothetical protein
METVFFDYLLKGIGAPLSTIRAEPRPDPEKNLAINLTVTADPSVALQPPRLYYSFHTTNDTWEKRNWIELDAPLAETSKRNETHSFSVTMPANIATQNVDWFALVSDSRGAWATTASTLVFNTGDPSH